MQKNSWYYIIDGQQHGPLSIDQIKTKIASNELNLETLFWCEGMKDWEKANTIPILTSPAVASSPAPRNQTPTQTESNPYATPASIPSQINTDNSQIPVTPIPLDIGFCIQQGWRIGIKNLGMIIGLGLIYWIISAIAGGVLSAIGAAIDGPPVDESITITNPSEAFLKEYTSMGIASWITQTISYIIATFLSLGATSFGLKLLRGENPSIAELFSQGDKLWKAFGAYILYALIVGIGFLLLIVPGIYFAIKLMFYQTAIVDKNLGIMESFKYSSELTRDNKMNLLGLSILTFLILIAGALAILIGLIWAWPCAWLSIIVAYRYLHAGEEAIPVRII